MKVEQGWRSGLVAALFACAAASAGCSANDDTGQTAGAGRGGGSAGGGSGGTNPATGEGGGEVGGRAGELDSGATPVLDSGNAGTQADSTVDAAPINAGDGSRSDGNGMANATDGSARAGVFVAVGYGGRTVRSTDDGRTWIDDTSLAAKGGDDDKLLRTVTWGNGKFVALGYRVLTSVDGKVWQQQGAVLSQWIGAASYAKGIYVAVGGYGLRATSADGVTWKDRPIDEIASHAQAGLAFGDVLGGRFVATNDDGRRSYATDGTDWKYGTGATEVMTTALAFGRGVFVGIGDDQVVVSRDGSTWTAGVKLAAPVAGLAFANDHFTAVGNGHVFTSSDGSAWDDHPVKGLVGGPLAFGHGTYVVVSDTSLRRSTDALTWESPVAVGGNNPLEWVTFGSL